VVGQQVQDTSNLASPEASILAVFTLQALAQARARRLIYARLSDVSAKLCIAWKTLGLIPTIASLPYASLAFMKSSLTVALPRKSTSEV